MSILNYATRQVVSVSPDSSVDKAIALMEEFNVHHLPVIDGDRVVGMLSDRDILLSVGWRSAGERKINGGDEVVGPQRVHQIMSRPAVTISPEQHFRQAARQMIDRKINALPVIRDGRLVGILTEADLLTLTQRAATPAAPRRQLFERPVREFMRAGVTTVTPRTPISEIIDLFRRRRLRHVPVAIEGALLGIISDRDVRRTLAEATLRDTQAQESGAFYMGAQTAMEIMTRDVHTVPLDAPLKTAVDKLITHRIHCLPVVAGEIVVGIITHTDVLAAIARTNLF